MFSYVFEFWEPPPFFRSAKRHFQKVPKKEDEKDKENKEKWH